MDSIILILLIAFAFGSREFIYKPIARKYPPKLAMVLDGVGNVLLAIIVLSITKETFQWHWTLIFSFGSGWILSHMTKYNQIIRKESTSATAYLPIIGLGLGVFVAFAYGERLNYFQYIVIAATGLIGILFTRKFVIGLSKPVRKSWFIVLLSTVYVISMPVLVLQYTNWISIFIARAIANLISDGMVIPEVLKDLKSKGLKLKPTLFLAGIWFSLGELLCMYSNPIMGVTDVLIAKRISIPIVMLLSWKIFKEHSGKDQKIFSLLSIILIILFYLGEMF